MAISGIIRFLPVAVLAHFARASVMPALALYVSSHVVLVVIRLLRRNTGFRPVVWRKLLDKGHVIFLVSMIFVAYTLAAAWYIPIGGTSTRQFLPLMVPFFWTLGLVMHTAPVQELRLRLDHYSIKAFNLVLALPGLILLDEILLVLTVRAATVYGPK